MSGPLSISLDFARATVPADPFAFHLAPTDYLIRTEGGGVRALRIAWSDDLLDDITALSRPKCPKETVQRVGDELRSMLEPAGWARFDAAITQAVLERRSVVITIRSAAAEIYALPWELVTLRGSGQHLGEIERVLVRYEWPDTVSAEEDASSERVGRVLLAWSAAGGAVPAASHLEVMKRAADEGYVPFSADRDVIANASIDRIASELSRAQDEGDPIRVLHLTCHGGSLGDTFGLVLNDPNGGASIAGAGDLRQLLAPHAPTLRLVVIAACDGGNPGALGNHLGSVAQAVHRAGIRAVIASRFPLSVPGSVRFTESFYGELLVAIASVERAFVAARRRLAAEPGRLDWAGVVLYSHAAGGADTRPLFFRPYRGLLAFQAKHSRFFFGRAAERRELVGRVRAALEGRLPRFQAVAGASGSGKSSLVFAGLVAELASRGAPCDVASLRLARRRTLHHALSLALGASGGDVDMSVGATLPYQGGAAWDGRVIAAAASQRRARSSRTLLLIVDQFEEIFTSDYEPAERDAFLQTLWSFATSAAPPVVVLATVRVDFLGYAGNVVIQDRGRRVPLDKVLYDHAHTFFVPQLTAEQVRAIIEEPAARVGLAFERGLVDRILDDLGGDVSALPLVEYALDELWRQRRGGYLLQDAYQRMGGLKGALARRADDTLRRMSDAEQVQARRILVRMVNVGEGGADTRRRAFIDRMRPVDPAAAAAFDAALKALVKSRLVVEGDADPSDPNAGAWAEVAHEALIRAWERLRRWVAEDKEVLKQLSGIERSSEEWEAYSKSPRAGEYLLRAGRLSIAVELQRTHAGELGAPVLAFIRASEEAERAHVRSRRLRTWLLSAGAGLIGLGGAAAGISLVEPAPGPGSGPWGDSALCARIKCQAVTHKDPSKVDMMDVLPAATKLARSLDASAALCGVKLRGVSDGLVDLRAAAGSPPINNVSFCFVGKGRPGAERVMDVSFIRTSILTVTEVGTGAALPLPCSPKDAFRAALANGVPRGVVATMEYRYDSRFNAPMWSFDVSGYTQHSRSIDGRTCVVKRFTP